jgi:hypothetical protein
MENRMKPVIASLFAVTLSAACLSANAATMRPDLLGEPAQPASAERNIVTAVAQRTIDITGGTKWVNVKHGEVIRFVSNGREFTWSFDGVSQPRPFDMAAIAPAGFVDHGVKVYVSVGDDGYAV